MKSVAFGPLTVDGIRWQLPDWPLHDASLEMARASQRRALIGWLANRRCLLPASRIA